MRPFVSVIYYHNLCGLVSPSNCMVFLWMGKKFTWNIHCSHTQPSILWQGHQHFWSSCIFSIKYSINGSNNYFFLFKCKVWMWIFFCFSNTSSGNWNNCFEFDTDIISCLILNINHLRSKGTDMDFICCSSWTKRYLELLFSLANLWIGFPNS